MYCYKIDGEDLHEYYRFLLKEYPDVLEVKKVSEITGYAIPVINRWCNKGKVKYFSIRAMNMIPKIYLRSPLKIPRTILKKLQNAV